MKLVGNTLPVFVGRNWIFFRSLNFLASFAFIIYPKLKMLNSLKNLIIV